MIIAIDGPAGAGKSTVAKILAENLGFLYIDTGAMYRCLALKALDQGIDIQDTDKIIVLAKNTSINLLNNSDATLRVLLDGKDVSEAIRKPRVTQVVSDVAKIKEVRQIMVELQRKLGVAHDSVMDGRDIGTVVFPDAQRKFYLDAHFTQRASRRYKEHKGLGNETSLEDVKNDLYNRDTIDSTREFSPLKKADDAIYVDTTNMSIDEVVAYLVDKVK